MKRTHLMLMLLIVLIACHRAWAAPSPASAQTADTFVKGLLGTDRELAWKLTPLKGFGPSGALLALTRGKEERGPLSGWLVYQRDGMWTKAALPSQDPVAWELWEVKDVFTAPVGGAPLLIVRAEHVIGAGPRAGQPFSVTWIFRWDGQHLRARSDLTNRVGPATTRAAILRKLGAGRT